MRRFLRRVDDGSNMLVSINPLSIPSLELYLRSDTIVGADGSGVATWAGASWPDSSPHARNAALGVHTSPLLRKSGANLSPKAVQVVDFGVAVTNGLQSFMGGVPIGDTNGWTMLAYYKSVVLDAGHNNDIFDCPTGLHFEFVAQSDVPFNGYDRDGRPGFDMAPAAVTRKTFDPLSTLGWNMFSITCNPPPVGAGLVVGVMNGAQMTPTFSGWDCSLEGNLHVGNNAGSNSNLDGTLACLLVFSSALTAGQRIGVVNFLKGIFG